MTISILESHQQNCASEVFDGYKQLRSKIGNHWRSAHVQMDVGKDFLFARIRYLTNGAS